MRAEPRHSSTNESGENCFKKLNFFRVPLILNEAARLNFGFASNMVLLLWCVCGGLLLHMLEANYLTILLKPEYEKAVDTVEEILDRGMTVITQPGMESKVELMKNSPYNSSRELAARTKVAKVIFHYIKIFRL